MTAIFAAVGTSESLDRATVRRILAAAAPRCGELVDVQVGDGFAIGSATTRGDARESASVFVDERVVLASDATLYHVAELRRAVSASPMDRLTEGGANALLRAAFRMFGQDCVTHLDGDFAFVAWDRSEQRLFCARDFTGRRPLYYARHHGGIVIASSLACFSRIPGFRAVADIATVGADAAGLFFAVDDETCIRGVRTLGAGCTMTWEGEGPVRVERVWEPAVDESNGLTFDDAALHLRELLQAATLERIARGGPTAVWMSGGRDSTAVFAAGKSALAQTQRATALFPVSRSHPIGDVEREDEAAAEVGRFWDSTVSWVDVKQVAMFPAGDGSRRTAHDSFQQPFQELTRALAGAARAGGARVVLDGHGGDFLFQVSRAYLGDLVARGNVMRAWHEWRAIDRGREGARGFIRSAIQPALPGAALRAASVALGRPVLGPMERPTPPWIEAGFTAAHDIEARQRALGADAQPGRTASERETRFCLTHPFFARVNAAMAEHALEYGVELRSPLLARRVVEFALTRPREERNHAGDQKRLLRAAMRGLLPESVLAPRLRKQGTLATYFAYNMTTAGLAALRRTMPLVALADHGVVNPRAFSKAVERFAAEGPAYPHIEALYCTLQAELWLRAHEGSVPAQTIDTARMQAVPALFSHGGDTAPHLRRAGSPATLLETE